MIKVGNFVIVENIVEFEENRHPIREDLFDGAVLPDGFNADEMTFPLALELSPTWDPRFLDSWFIADLKETKEKMIIILEKEIEEKKKIIEKIQKRG